MDIFEFGYYWDTCTFLFMLVLGCVVSICCRLGAIQNEKISKNNKISNFNFWYILAFSVLLFVYTFKSETYGADTYIYINNWLTTTTFYFEHGSTHELAFVFFNYLTRLISDNYTFYFFTAGIIISYGYIKFIKEFWEIKSNYIFLILLFIPFSYDMNIMRSAMGLSFLHLSLCSLKRTNNFTAMAYTIVAMLFQFTLIVNFLFIIFYNILKRTTKLKFKWVFLVMFLSILFSMGFCHYFIDFFANHDRYGHYVLESKPNILGMWAILLSGLLGFWNLYFRKTRNTIEDIAIIASLFSIVLIVPYLMMGAYRLTMYYFMPRLLLWGISVDKFKKKSPYNYLIKESISIIFILFYALFTMSRRSSYIGFEFDFINFF